ncbi:MAG: hypothetical protein BM556_17660 [Bacteriovorax sp. MedPE-SWde]|nr:MAG: hypothetical protein BM556_17660 [Bacteriovorax sp. MedPE-SWde]
MQIILVEANEIIRDLISLNIKTYLGVDVILRTNAQEAIELMNILPEIDLVISSVKNGDENSCSDIAQFIIDGDNDIPLIVLGEMPTTPAGIEEIATSSAESDWENTIKIAAKSLGINEDVISKRKIPDFIPITINYFFNLSTSCCDVYIRIKKGPSDYQYVKRIHQGDVFSQDVIKKYHSQGLKNLYIPKEQQSNFTNFVSNNLVKMLNQPSMSADEKLSIMGNSYDIATKEILKIGFNSATVQLTETIINNMIETFKDEEKVSPLLRKIINSKTSYIYQHSHMTAVVSSEILKNLGEDDPASHEKMSYAAFFKDISLADREELAQINSFEELENATISEEDWDMVFNHALEGAVLIRHYPEAPLDIDNIIKHHHGSPNGKGFSVTGQDSKFDLLSLVFIIAVEFVNELMSYKVKGGTPKPVIEELRKKYTSEETISIIDALEKTLKKSVKE